MALVVVGLALPPSMITTAPAAGLPLGTNDMSLDATGVAPASHGDVREPGPPIAVERYWVDSVALAEQARARGEIALELGRRSLVVALEENELRAADWASYVRDGDGHLVPLEPVESLGTYRARLLDHPSWDSSLTLVPGFFAGSLALSDCANFVLTSEEGEAGRLPITVFEEDLCIGTDGARLAMRTGRPAYEATEDPGAEADERPPSDQLIGPIGQYLTVPQDLNLATGWSRPSSTKTVRIALDGNQQFAGGSSCTADWRSRGAAVVNDMQNKIWNKQLNVDLRIAIQVIWCPGGPTTNNCNSLLDFVTTDWRSNFGGFPRDSVLFFQGGTCSDNAYGWAHQRGPGDTWGYAVMQWGSLNTAERYRLGAHEVGHNYNADHGYANQWRAWQCAWLCSHGTIMSCASLANTIDEYSEGNNDEKNSWRVRSTVENPREITKKSGKDCP